MKSLFSTLGRQVAIMVFTVGLSGCGCDTWGCIDGLFVRFASQPPAPWKVELLVGGVLQAAPVDAACDSNPRCNQLVGVRYTNQLASLNVSVRITTSAGVRTTDFPPITYTGKSPRSDCHDCKGQAEVIANIP